MSTSQHERKVISEFIELLKLQRCLWDSNSTSFKDTAEKSKAWNILAEKLKELDADANVASARKKVENLKAAYKREVKKVEESLKKAGPDDKELYVHKPILWYFKLMTFLDRSESKTESKRQTVTITRRGDDGESHRHEVSKRKEHNERHEQDKKRKKIDTTTQHQPSKVSGAFGTYVEEKLKKVYSYQRIIAEKLISDIIFLARTNSLTLDSKVVTIQKAQNVYPSHIDSNSDVHTTQYNVPPLCFIQSPSFTQTLQTSQPTIPHIDIKSSPHSSPSLQTTESSSEEEPLFFVSHQDTSSPSSSLMELPTSSFYHSPQTSDSTNFHVKSTPLEDPLEPASSKNATDTTILASEGSALMELLISKKSQ